MTTENLTALLAQNVMGWRVAPGRFLMQNRRWLPDHRFQPTKRLADAHRVLEKAAPKRYTIGGDEAGVSFAEVQIGGVTGRACDRSIARALSYAIARALRLEVGEQGRNDPGWVL